MGGGAEAAAAEEKFSHENVMATLSVTPCWCYGSETMDLNPMTVMANWGANHGAFAFGHIGADLITLASMLRIPVAMHNVDGPLFRPHCRGAFGTKDAEGADYRACAAYGSLYK